VADPCANDGGFHLFFGMAACRHKGRNRPIRSGAGPVNPMQPPRGDNAAANSSKLLHHPLRRLARATIAKRSLLTVATVAGGSRRN
jgi:hypothetical protein